MGIINVRSRGLRKHQTVEEKLIWEHLREYRWKGYIFRRQHPVSKLYVNGVCYFYIADFYCARMKLVIEIDGPIHNYQKEADKIRQEAIELNGLTVIRFTNKEVRNEIYTVLNKIIQHLPDFPLT